VIAADAPIFRFDCVESTMDEARRLFAEGQVAPFWVRADSQTAGRGRRGRAWVSAPGNLFCTYGADLDAPPGQAALLGFVAALAVADLADAAAGRACAQLKWPNDVLADGGKCAGILLEAETAPDAATRLLLGVGVNLCGAPADVGQEAMHLGRLGATPSVESAFADLTARLVHWSAMFAAEGFGPIRTAWLARARGVGAPIGVTIGAETVTGRFATLSESGELVIDLALGGVRSISAGDVFFPEIAS
jgi:BirA family transcriptional regulator, biotin operon repressor / biotin---[acetyl-CoA-carboxylase] ligase